MEGVAIEPPQFKLPLELWDLIFSYGLDRKDFLKLSVVDRNFNRAVEPSLYSTFSWIPDIIRDIKPSLPPYSNLKNRNVQTLTKTRRRKWTRHENFSLLPPYLLLRSILDKPQRAGYIKHAKLLVPSLDSGVFWDAFQARECGLSCEEFKTCKDIIDLLPSGLRPYWTDGLSKGRLDVTVGLLLLRLSGLTSIELRMRDTSAIGSPVFEALTSSLGTTLHHQRYPNLKAIKVSIDRQEGEPLRDIVDQAEDDIFNTYAPVPSLLHFRNLELLSLYACSPGSNWHRKLDIAKNLKQLTLRHGVINERHLKEMLKATPRLEDLNCELFYDDGLLQYLECKVLKGALETVKTTLKRLVLDVTVIYDFGLVGHPQWNIVNFMGPLKSFKKLRHVDIPLILYGEEIYQASVAASLVPFDDRAVEYYSERLPDGIEWFGIRDGPSLPGYEHQREAERVLEVFFRMNTRVKRIIDRPLAGED